MRSSSNILQKNYSLNIVWKINIVFEQKWTCSILAQRYRLGAFHPWLRDVWSKVKLWRSVDCTRIDESTCALRRNRSTNTCAHAWPRLRQSGCILDWLLYPRGIPSSEIPFAFPSSCYASDLQSVWIHFHCAHAKSYTTYIYTAA